ncbi:uncharacterized protein LOC121419067 [Lytechinus variegatus]|uniref:uncharacterized protein LOC121419065 n=1 Tax=Lytechinus variegatus TaxID=7654 RepID=UPI001BB10FBF|nr:uncharacterized protein LOC121419065 [Lytechinus variegatus]XP_041469291.1 uncharacterized protein LOC121419067 [Lytechinus variegatus]
MYFPDSTFQMVESALSPPYDGSEFQDLFPELTGVEPDEMVDIESLADHAASSLQQPDDVVENHSVMLNDNVSIHSQDSYSERGSVYECDDVSEGEVEEHEDADQLLRYLIAPVSQTQSKTKQLRRQSSNSNDSERFPDRSRDQGSTIHHPDSPPPSAVVTTRKYTRKSTSKARRNGPKQMPASSTTCFTVVDEKGSCKSVQGPNRNAVMAKLNRERKKQLMVELEEKVGLLDTENDALKKQNVRLRKRVDILSRELQYVKNVLANQSTLSSLLKNIKATGLEFHTSMPLQSNPSRVAKGISRVNQKRKRQFDHDYCLEQNDDEFQSPKVARSGSKGKKDDGKTDANVNLSNCDAVGGVCLHVLGENVSLEFCSKCSAKANLAGSRC